MYNNSKEQAIEYVKQVVKEDYSGNYAKAFPLYTKALKVFQNSLEKRENPNIPDAITEEIRVVLNEGGVGSEMMLRSSRM
ncbi:putative MIT domain superfamily protein [Helianthus anomalus]